LRYLRGFDLKCNGGGDWHTRGGRKDARRRERERKRSIRGKGERGQADGGVGENGPRGVAARARVWTDGSPAWEPCSSCEERKGAGKEGGGDGRGRKRRRVEGGGVGGGGSGGGGGDDDDGSGAPSISWKLPHIHKEGARGSRGGESGNDGGQNSFVDDPATCRIDWQLWPSDCLLCCCSFHSFPRRGVSVLPS